MAFRLRYEEEGVGLVIRAVSFQDFQHRPM